MASLSYIVSSMPVSTTVGSFLKKRPKQNNGDGSLWDPEVIFHILTMFLFCFVSSIHCVTGKGLFGSLITTAAVSTCPSKEKRVKRNCFICQMLTYCNGFRASVSALCCLMLPIIKAKCATSLPFYTFSTSHVHQHKASLWNEGWASHLDKQNFLATAFENTWNWILIIENPPSSLGTGEGGASRHLFSPRTDRAS